MYTISDIVGVVEDADLSYAIIEGISPSRIKDPELATMWEDARDLLIRIQEHLDNHGTDDEDSDDELSEFE